MTKFNIANNEEFRALVRKSRRRELHELTRGLFSGAMLVYGEAGIGKSALLELFRADNPGAYIKITLLRGYEIELDESVLLPYLLPTRQRTGSAFPELLIIDGLDEVTSPAKREKVVEITRESLRMEYKLVLSSRQQPNEKAFQQYAHSFKLWPLNEEDRDALVDLYDHHFAEHPGMTDKLKGMLHELDGNPKNILDFLQFTSGLNIVSPVIYQNSVALMELERPEIITDLRCVNQRVLDRIGRRPEAVHELTPRQFEELVSELFLEQGYEVKLTQQTRDGGKDLVIMHRSDIGNLMVYAECKHYRPDRPVGVSVVSELLGRINFDRATAGMVVTSSYFSPDAKDFQSKIKHQMSLIDFAKLSSMIQTKSP